jgi:translation elongation factor EF-Tu-like GTPase
MLPDFSKPAFAFIALSTLRFRATEEGGGPDPYQSDYHCQLRYASDPKEVPDAEVRVYFVGCEKVNAGDDVPALLAFLDWERQREMCQEGSAFALREGGMVIATGIVHAIATRRSGT